MFMVDIRNTSVMLRGSINMVFQVGVGVEDHKKYSRKIAGIARSPRYNQDMINMCWKGDKGVVNDNSNH